MTETFELNIEGTLPRKIVINPSLTTEQVVINIYRKLNEAIQNYLDQRETDGSKEELEHQKNLLNVSNKLEKIIEASDYNIVLPSDYLDASKEEVKSLKNAKIITDKEIETNLLKLLIESNNIIELAKQLNSLDHTTIPEEVLNNLKEVLENNISIKKDNTFKKNSVANIMKQELNVLHYEESYGFNVSRIYFKATDPSSADILFGETIEKY